MGLVVATLCSTTLSVLFLFCFLFAAFLSEFLYSLSGSTFLHLFGLHIEKVNFALHAAGSTAHCGANRFEPDVGCV